MRSIDDGMIVTLGMLADAAIEMDAFVHMCDSAEFDEAMLQSKLDVLYATLRRLFVDGMCFEVPGLTWLAVQTLCRPRTYVLNGVPKTVGSATGPSHILKGETLKRMRAWTVVALAVIGAEFPEWELMATFRVFDLQSGCAAAKQSPQPIGRERQGLLTKLANVLQLPAAELIDQFHVFEPMAIRNKKINNCSNFAAWSSAVLPTQSRQTTAKAKEKYTASCLIPVLARYGAWVSSSSEVERGFAKTSKIRGGQSEDLNTSNEESILLLQSDLPQKHEVPELISAACKLWAKFYGRPRVARQHRQPRIDAGIKKVASASGEASYLRKRSEITRALAGQLGQVLPSMAGDVDEMDDLAEQHVAECVHNEEKDAKRKVEAFLAGHLLDSEVTEDILRGAEAHVVRMAKNQRELQTEKSRKRKRVLKDAHDIAGANVFVICEDVSITARTFQLHSVKQVVERYRR